MDRKELRKEELNNDIMKKVEEMQTTETTMGKEKKKQKVSTSYTIKSYANNIKKLEETKMITREEGDTLRHIYKKMVDRWVSIEMTL